MMKKFIDLKDIILSNLEEIKAVDPIVMDVKKLGVFTDCIIVVTGTSSRHIKSISSLIIRSLKDVGFNLLGVEGQESEDWVLLDMGDLVLHVMTDEARNFYDLEGLWDIA